MRRLLLLLFIALLIAPRVLAHGYIVRAIPQDRAVLDRSPTRLQYWFSEALEPGFSSLNVRDQSGEIIATGGISEHDSALMMVRLPDNLPEGAYLVELRPAFASDGHVVAESRVFFVGQAVGGIAGQAASGSANRLEVAWKALHYTAAMTLFGAFTLYTLVLIPAWGSPTHPAGLLPPRVMRRLWLMIGAALFVIVIANIIGLIQQTMVFFNTGFSNALDMNFIRLVRVGSRFGDIWNWRMALLFLLGIMFAGSLYLKREQPEIVRPTLAANGWIMALVLGTSSILSHAAGSLMLPWVGIAVDWLHMLTVGFWVGGLLALVLVLPVALQPYSGEDRRLALLAVMRRFSRLAAAALVIVIATGIYNASNWITGADEARSGFGLTLLVKLALVAGLVAVGMLHHIATSPERYARFQRLADRFRGFGGTLRLEALLALAVLLATAWLSATPVPVPTFAQNEAGAVQGATAVDDWTVTMALSPGGPGINSYDVQVRNENGAMDGLTVTLQSVSPARDRRSPVHTLESVDSGLYVTTTDDMDREGIWWSLLDLKAADGSTRRAAFAWEISEEAAVIASLDPSPVQLAALLVVVVALAYALQPLARRGAARLQLDPASVTVATSVTVLTIGALIVGYNVIQQTRQDYNAALEPEPQAVNVMLPDQASLDRGQALFSAHCDGWLAQRAELAALIDRMPRTRDEELYGAVTAGWRTLPACENDLGETEIWDMVNYIRRLNLDLNS